MVTAKTPGPSASRNSEGPLPHTLGRETGRGLISETSCTKEATICSLFMSRGMKKRAGLMRTSVRKRKASCQRTALHRSGESSGDTGKIRLSCSENGPHSPQESGGQGDRSPPCNLHTAPPPLPSRRGLSRPAPRPPPQKRSSHTVAVRPYQHRDPSPVDPAVLEPKRRALLAVRWLAQIHASGRRGCSSIPGQGTEMPHATQAN